MSTLFKTVLFLSPIFTLVFFYVVSRQTHMDVEMKKEGLEFEREWNEFLADFDKDFKSRQRHTARAARAERQLREIEKKEREKEEKLEEFEREFERAIKEFEQEHNRGVKE